MLMFTHRRPVFLIISALAFLLLAGATVGAQVSAPATCPALVLQALETVNDLCQGQGRNSACYGNYLVEARLAGDQPADVFDAQGDIAALNLLTSLKTAPLNADLSEWGVSILSVQASVPGALPGQNAMFMLLGGAEIESAIQPGETFLAAAPPVSMTLVTDAPLRERPTTNEAVSATLLAGTALLADAHTDGFVRVVAGDQFGWVEFERRQRRQRRAELPARLHPGRELHADAGVLSAYQHR